MTFQLCVIILAVFVSLWNNGSIWNITNIRLKNLWFLPIGYVLQPISEARLHGISYEFGIVISYVLVLWFCCSNIRVHGIKWTTVGTILNFVCLLSNNLRMPAFVPSVWALYPKMVRPLEQGLVGKSIAMGPHTHLNFLADIFTFKVYSPCIISIGDVLFGIGIFIFLQYAMKLHKEDAIQHEAVLHQA